MGEEQLTITELMEKVEGEALTLERALELFQRIYMQSRNLAELTRKEYRLDLRQLIRFLSHLSIRSVDDVKLAHLQAFLADLEDRGLDASTRRRKCSSIKVFYRFLVESNFLASSPATRLIPPHRAHKQRRRLSSEEAKALVKAASAHPRDAVIIQLFVQTGIGLSEIARLAVNDVKGPSSSSGGGVLVDRKGRDEFLPIDDKASEALNSWLSVRPQIEQSALFVNRLQEPMSTRAFQRVVEKYSRIAGIRKTSPRMLRNTFESHH